jgi:hypothetical protein
MVTLRVSMMIGVGLAAGATAAEAGPCTTQIEEVSRDIERVASGAATGPTAPQSIGAQLHHQPTPSSVEDALTKARAEARAALDRAREADARGDATACAKALTEAKEIFELQ